MAPLVVCVLGTTFLGACSTSSGNTSATASTSVPSLAGGAVCGKRIRQDISSASSGDPSVRASIAKVARTSDGFTATLQIKETRPGQAISLPVIPVSPTAVILVEGMVAAYQPVSTSTLATALNALGFNLDQGPYQSVQHITALCPGYSWAKLANPATKSTVTVYLSRPSNTVPDSTHLLGATHQI